MLPSCAARQDSTPLFPQANPPFSVPPSNNQSEQLSIPRILSRAQAILSSGGHRTFQHNLLQHNLLSHKGMVSLWNLFAFWYMNGHVSWSGLLAVQMNTKGKRSGSILTTFISGPSIRANKGILFPAAISIFSFFCRHTLQLQAMCDDNAPTRHLCHWP